MVPVNVFGLVKGGPTLINRLTLHSSIGMKKSLILEPRLFAKVK